MLFANSITLKSGDYTENGYIQMIQIEPILLKNYSDLCQPFAGSKLWYPNDSGIVGAQWCENHHDLYPYGSVKNTQRIKEPPWFLGGDKEKCHASSGMEWCAGHIYWTGRWSGGEGHYCGWQGVWLLCGHRFDGNDGGVADVGVLQRLPLIVGQGITRELAFTAKNITAERAEQILLVNQVVEDYETLLAEAEKMARQIADNSPLAVQASKDVLNFGVGKSIDDGLKYVASISANIIPSNDLMEAVTAFMEKRKPKFTEK